ncbi:Pimeloyl-ACP methyl ester carboxylesterase [Fodinibius roseus]|uniref:Pimeloyl-ACP methyl ester carboxylesterase n=1 Tax=Fodinibius roseus TaxID=1194090 RepID=A0A1M4YUU5_9BACT|nr:alpha/beta hydrolase [Fodinibius roseus]SHF09272.1 Pimeloyl-ACP methyl ester carboxylesterase [Fodinibius roseus]
MRRKIERTIGTYLNAMADIAPNHAGRLGFKLFGWPAKKNITPAGQQFLDRSKAISFQHCELNLRGYQWGYGPKKILLLHGWQSHSARWKELVRLFPTSQYTVYAIDAPGHGQSGGHFFSAPLYGEVIMQFGQQIGKLDTIIGHSLGAFSTFYAVSRFNLPKAEHLVVIGTPGKTEDFLSYFKQRLDLNKKALRCIRNYFEKETGVDLENIAISRFAEQLDLPGLIIHDRNDRFAPFAYAEELDRKWSDADLIVTKGLGHNLSSDEVNNEIFDFVRG